MLFFLIESCIQYLLCSWETLITPSTLHIIVFPALIHLINPQDIFVLYSNPSYYIPNLHIAFKPYLRFLWCVVLQNTNRKPAVCNFHSLFGRVVAVHGLALLWQPTKSRKRRRRIKAEEEGEEEIEDRCVFQLDAPPSAKHLLLRSLKWQPWTIPANRSRS